MVFIDIVYTHTVYTYNLFRTELFTFQMNNYSVLFFVSCYANKRFWANGPQITETQLHIVILLTFMLFC